jgi:hypothetical protein
MNLCEIAEMWLMEHGYDGLVECEGTCGCGVGENFIPCGSPGADCQPAYQFVCQKCAETCYAGIKDAVLCTKCSEEDQT